ncbi:MAG: 5-formyltetrahydrofolate cyclo-ligase [Bacteroidales bacterium]|nr:5-formyltetrahydrofolate cyclo-ligase [Candidatus Egerieousia equi]
MKVELRKNIKQRLREMSPVECKSASQSIWDKLMECNSFKAAHTVLLFWSIAGEPETHEFIERISASKRIVLPVVNGNELVLKEYNPSTMVTGAFNILEPGPSAVTLSPQEIEFAVIPGLAFDLKGRRLGRGKGFYDRLLPQLDCHKAGVCYACAIVDNVPADSWDMPVDSVIYA